MAKNTRPGERAWATVRRTGGDYPWEVTLLPLVVNGCQAGSVVSPGYVRRSEDRLCEAPPALRRKAASPRRAGPNGRSSSWPSAGSPAAPPGGSVPRRRSHETSHPVTVGFNLFCPGCQPVALRATGVDTQGIGSSSRAKMELLKMSDTCLL